MLLQAGGEGGVSIRFTGSGSPGFGSTEGWRDLLVVHHFEVAEVGVEHDVQACGGDEEGERKVGEGREEVYWRGFSVSVGALRGLGEGTEVWVGGQRYDFRAGAAGIGRRAGLNMLRKHGLRFESGGAREWVVKASAVGMQVDERRDRVTRAETRNAGGEAVVLWMVRRCVRSEEVVKRWSR